VVPMARMETGTPRASHAARRRFESGRLDGWIGPLCTRLTPCSTRGFIFLTATVSSLRVAPEILIGATPGPLQRVGAIRFPG